MAESIFSNLLAAVVYYKYALVSGFEFLRPGNFIVALWHISATLFLLLMVVSIDNISEGTE
jgi:hypothetical protein